MLVAVKGGYRAGHQIDITRQASLERIGRLLKVGGPLLRERGLRLRLLDEAQPRRTGLPDRLSRHFGRPRTVRSKFASQVLPFLLQDTLLPAQSCFPVI